MIFSAYPRHTLHSQKNSNIVGHYEFSSSSNSQPPPSSRDPPAPIAVIFPDPFAFHQPTPGEKYITYLPHSGFHNQRIELENALLLASYLNRTLLLPPVFLGNPAMPWLRYEKMYERLLLQTKRGLEHCPRFEPDESIPAECLNYFRWTSVPWSFFYDMGVFQDKVRIVQRNDLSLEWMYESLGLTEKNVRFMRDMSPYEFRVYDNPASTTPLAKFVNRIELASLEAIQEPLIHFGSVFGTYRVLAQTEEHAELLRFIRTHMIFKNPVLVDTTARIVEQLGGVGSFVGLHIRVGDGLFKVRASINVDDIYHELVNKFTDLDVSQVKALEEYKHDQDRQENTDYEVRQLRKFRPLEDTAKPVEVHHPPAAELEKVLGPRPEIALPCQAANSVTEKFQKTVIYIATDASDPRNNPLLRKIFATFPCVFTLSDFAKELSDLQRIQVVEEKVKLTSYLIPMLDAMISAQGHTFFGTKDSTFSSYIERQLHPVYTNKEVKVMKVPGKQATAAVTTTQPIDGNFHP
ncbi:CigA protein [Radiomyces spectabilis]|uniref:CigA protein n=1 Tax=Radiomyces spectabilis TaxID=64574 RepID=UPI00221E986F|nr:CigA protein [Radiomyces spectabilis]KAI8377423.1 CigA protein [Radiomyces spectabilis]